jgi:FkbM family methyltransferase
MQPDLVFDVGMNNGDDTGYYLARGYRVVAVEADPTLAEAAAAKFPQALRDRRLTILNCAIGATEGRARFWICDGNAAWNSLDREAASRHGEEARPIEVQVRTFAGIMREFGVPYYAKIDIEGFDRHCLEAIDPADRPVHLSWEISDVGDLFLVRSKGYNAFKCISQTRFEPLEIGARRGSVRLARLDWLRLNIRSILGRSALGRSVLQAAARKVHGTADDGRARPRIARTISWSMPREAGGPASSGSWDFAIGSSGPFGDDLGGSWKAAETVAYEYLDFWLHAGRCAGVNNRDWFDVHATTLPPEQAPVVGTAISH